MKLIPEEIIIRASRGDIDAFECIYQVYAQPVLNTAFRIVDNIADAEEITQQVFLNIFQKLPQFKFRSSLKTWIYRITVNLALNYEKKLVREREMVVEYDEGILCPCSFRNLNIDQIGETESKKVESYLKILPPEQRVCIVLRNIEGLSYREIAETLNININTVRSRLKRARDRLLALKKGVSDK